MQEGVESQQSNNYSVDNEVVIFGEDDTLQQQAGATNSKTQNRQGKKNRRTYVRMETKKHEIHHLQDEQGDKFSLQTQIHFLKKQGNLDTSETDKQSTSCNTSQKYIFP